MFTCEACGNVSAPKEQSRAWVSSTRRKTYALLDKHGKRIGKSVGWEIVREMRLCAGCHEEAVRADEYRQQQETEKQYRDSAG